MALYLPRYHIAIDVVDDPCSSPVDREAFPDLSVVPLTCEQMAHPELLDQMDGTAKDDADARTRRCIGTRVRRLLEEGGIAARGGSAPSGRHGAA